MLKSGARGLRSILESSMLETMYNCPSDKSIKDIIIDANVIEKLSEAKINKNGDKIVAS